MFELVDEMDKPQGMKPETVEELQVRVADSQRAAEHHLRVRNAIVEMLRTPTPGMLQMGDVIASLDGSPAEIFDAMVVRGMLELFEAGRL